MALALQAPAKLNRFLAVLGRRPDGFHEVEMVTTVLDGVPGLADILEAEPAPALSLRIHGPAGAGLEVDESNLVLRAWRLIEATVSRTLPAALSLEKRIPHGAGLGGGSSDAAAALRLANELFRLGLPTEHLLALAAQLGSDVPLFLVGGTSLGLGRGERVVPLRPIPLEPMLLIHPGLHVSTPGVYRALAEVSYPAPAPLPALPEGAAPPWRNDLTAAALRLCPALGEVRDTLETNGAEALLCGSGSCWVGRFPTAAHRDLALSRSREAFPAWSHWPI
jgi:4-diphosphocytidyl-2-C-methyl-D-erythritol kinase